MPDWLLSSLMTEELASGLVDCEADENPAGRGTTGCNTGCHVQVATCVAWKATAESARSSARIKACMFQDVNRGRGAI